MKAFLSIIVTGLLLVTATASADTFANCTPSKMQDFAVANSMLPKTYGEPIIRVGGASSINQDEGNFLSSLVSSSGHQEIQFIRCDSEGNMTLVSSHNPALRVVLP